MLTDVPDFDPWFVESLSKVVDRVGEGEAAAPLLDVLEKKTRESRESAPRQPSEAYLDLIEFIKILDQSEQGRKGDTPSNTRGSATLTMLRLVQAITDADCVLLRRLLTDGSAELAGEPFWREGSHPELRPPRIKRTPGGHDSGILYFRSGRRPTVLADVRSEDTPGAIRATLRYNQELCQPGSPERNFIERIRAEVCVPLGQSGSVPAAVIAVRWQPYDQEQASRIEQALRSWQKVLGFIHAISLPNESHDRSQTVMDNVVTHWPRVVSALDDREFLRKAATILTCDSGLGWHRAFIYLFRKGFPSDAICVLAVGGLGDSSHQNLQRELRERCGSMAAYLSNAESSRFGEDDPLHQAIIDGSQRLDIPGDAFESHPAWQRLFTGNRSAWAKHRRGDQTAYFDAQDPLPLGEPSRRLAFDKRASTCGHFVLPLIRHDFFTPLGFILLDNPYDHLVEVTPDLPLTRLVCQMLTGCFVQRGLGLEGWHERHVGQSERSRRNLAFARACLADHASP